MAKLNGNNIESVLGNVSIYQVNGHTYMRSKSSLSRKRVLKSKAYEKTRQYASYMARAAQIGSEIYRGLGLNKPDRSLYQAITGEVASRLYRGEEEDMVRREVKSNYSSKTIKSL